MFQVGDFVRCIDASHVGMHLVHGRVYRVSDVIMGEEVELQNVRLSYKMNRFTSVLPVGDDDNSLCVVVDQFDKMRNTVAELQKQYAELAKLVASRTSDLIDPLAMPTFLPEDLNGRKWVAMDADGGWYAYYEKPEMLEVHFDRTEDDALDCCYVLPISGRVPFYRWRETCHEVKQPEPQKDLYEGFPYRPGDMVYPVAVYRGGTDAYFPPGNNFDWCDPDEQYLITEIREHEGNQHRVKLQTLSGEYDSRWFSKTKGSIFNPFNYSADPLILKLAREKYEEREKNATP